MQSKRKTQAVPLVKEGSKKCKNVVFDNNWVGGWPEPHPYCKHPLFFKTLYTSSIREVKKIQTNMLMDDMFFPLTIVLSFFLSPIVRHNFYI